MKRFHHFDAPDLRTSQWGLGVILYFHHAWLRDEPKGIRADLTGADFGKTVLDFDDLRGAKLHATTFGVCAPSATVPIDRVDAARGKMHRQKAARDEANASVAAIRIQLEQAEKRAEIAEGYYNSSREAFLWWTSKTPPGTLIEPIKVVTGTCRLHGGTCAIVHPSAGKTRTIHIRLGVYRVTEYRTTGIQSDTGEPFGIHARVGGSADFRIVRDAEVGS